MLNMLASCCIEIGKTTNDLLVRRYLPQESTATFLDGVLSHSLFWCLGNKSSRDQHEAVVINQSLV